MGYDDKNNYNGPPSNSEDTAPSYGDINEFVNLEGDVVSWDDVEPGCQTENYCDRDKLFKEVMSRVAIGDLKPDDVAPVDRYPDRPLPPVRKRMQFANMTSQIFDVMKNNDDKRAFALIFWDAKKKGMAGGRWDATLTLRCQTWLKEDKIQKWVKWAKKLENIRLKHMGKEPSLEFYTGKIEGIETTRAKVVWDDVATVKNEYYDRDIDEEYANVVSRCKELTYDDLTETEKLMYESLDNCGQMSTSQIYDYIAGGRRPNDLT
jgi:hypothetical protein